MSINEATLTLFFVSLCFLLLTFPKSQAGNCLELFPSLSTAASASGIFIAYVIGIHLCTKLYCVIEVNPFPAMRSSCALDCKDSVFCLVDSWDSTIQPYIVLNSFPWSFFCSTFVFTMLECCLPRLQGMAAAIGLSSLLLAFLIISEGSLSSGSKKKIPLSVRALSSFGFSFAHACFSRL